MKVREGTKLAKFWKNATCNVREGSEKATVKKSISKVATRNDNRSKISNDHNDGLEGKVKRGKKKKTKKQKSSTGARNRR